MNRRTRLLSLLAATTCLASTPALAQNLPGQSSGTSHGAAQAPVSFTAGSVTYNKTGNIITASGHVHAVQNGQTLTADKIVINRTTGVVTAEGHVMLTQPGGNTIFASHAVLQKGMKDAVLRGVSARLADNARIIANGAVRTGGGQIEELDKAVYSACDLCKTNPRHPPTWQIRATKVTRDLQHKMIEFTNPVIEMDGIPVFYFPFLTQPDPSVRRQSGLLFPSVGSTSKLGFFYAQPYFITLGKSADLTLTPIVAVKQGPALKADYREAFNKGFLDINLSGGRDHGDFGDSVFAKSVFDLNQDWRAGFDFNHASNPTYLEDFSILPTVAYLQSDVYLEGFSPGAYGRIEAQTFQGLAVSVTQSELPIVAPYAQYHFVSRQDQFGGRFSIDATAFNVYRDVGTSTRRAAVIPGYALPFQLANGITGTARVKLIAAGYEASALNEQPNYSTHSQASTARAEPYGAVYASWPFIRPAGNYGTQLIEPEVQIVAAPNIGISQNNLIPNEDSLDLQFSDANLFAFNRYPGIDRMGGGSRVDYALHAAWYLPHGAVLDGLIGQSYAFHKNMDYLPESGLTDNVSDIVARATVAPTPWLNFVYRTRLDHSTMGVRMIDTTVNFGTHTLNFSTGYLYSSTDPYLLYTSASPTGQVTIDPPAAYYQPRKEITASANANIGPWSFSAGMQRDLKLGQFDNINAAAGWQNNCFGINVIFAKQYTSYNLNNGTTVVLLELNFKTLGSVGFNAL